MKGGRRELDSGGGPGEPRSLSPAAVRELDRRATLEYGVPSLLLMENAGRASADAAEELLAEVGGGVTLVLAGPGNNGGDGLVVARTLVNRGLRAELYFIGELERIALCSEDVRKNSELWVRQGQTLHEVASETQLLALVDRLRGADLLVDALFGTGLTRELRDPWASVVRAMDAAPAPVLAVDVPSGLDAETGAVLGACARATVTVTFAAAKHGLLRRAGPERCGRLEVAEIGIPRALLDEAFASA